MAFDYITNPDSDHDFGYDRDLLAHLPEQFGAFKETWNKDGSLKQRQIRSATSGKVFSNIFSQAQGGYQDEVKKALSQTFIVAFLQNYDRLIGRGKGYEQTGTLRQSVAQGEFTDEEILEGYSMVYQIADLMRTRQARYFFGGVYTPAANMTRQYGPVIFRGRRAIRAGEKGMIFPDYAGGDTVMIKRGRIVRGVEPMPIFDLTDAQKTAVAQSVMKPIAEIIKDNIRRACNE